MAEHQQGCASFQGRSFDCTCGLGSIDGVAGEAACTECGRDNRNGTHDALQMIGHLAHGYSPPRDDTMDIAEALADLPAPANIPPEVAEAMQNAIAAAHVDATVPLGKSASAMAEEVYDFEVSKGWQPNDNTFGDSLALLHSEISEAFEAFREIGFQRRTHDPKHSRACRKQSHWDDACTCGALGKPDDVPSELIDMYIRLLSTWHQFMAPLGYRLEDEYERKMAYNRTRSHRHGGKRL